MSHLNVQFIQYIVLKISLEFVKKSTPPPPYRNPHRFYFVGVSNFLTLSSYSCNQLVEVSNVTVICELESKQCLKT